MKSAKELAEEHAIWLFSVLETIQSFRDLPEWAKQLVRKLYVDAIIHGYGHGREAQEEISNKIRG